MLTVQSAFKFDERRLQSSIQRSSRLESYGACASAVTLHISTVSFAAYELLCSRFHVFGICYVFLIAAELTYPW